MTTINVNEKTKLVHNKYQWEVHFFEDEKVIEVGPKKGHVSKGGWKASGSYFNTIEAALVFMTKEIVNDGSEYGNIGEYIERYRECIDKLREEVKNAMGI